jgi:hypothetical protein
VLLALHEAMDRQNGIIRELHPISKGLPRVVIQKFQDVSFLSNDRNDWSFVLRGDSSPAIRERFSINGSFL